MTTVARPTLCLYSDGWPLRILRCSVALELWGLAARRFYSGLESPIGDGLFHDWAWSEAAMLQLEDGAAWFFVVAGLFTLWRSSWLVLMPACVWLVAVPFVQWARDDGFFPALEPGEQAARALAPLALLLLEAGCKRGRYWMAAGYWLLKISLASTFISHGLAAIWHHPGFIDLILSADARLLGFGLSERQAKVGLDVIGYLDIFLGLAVVVSRWRIIAGYMAFWGLVTAASRPVAFGAAGVPDMLVRTPHFGIPLLLTLAGAFTLSATSDTRKDSTDRKTGNESD